MVVIAVETKGKIAAILVLCLAISLVLFTSGCTQTSTTGDAVYDQSYDEIEKELNSIIEDDSSIETELLQ